jgi:DNA-binding transcriptional regulator YiaG
MHGMPDIAAVLKSEIARLARKQTRIETESLRKSQSSHRAEIADLKRRLLALEQEVRKLRKAAAKSSAVEAATASEVPVAAIRFSANGLAKHRQRLGLSAEDCGKLLGVSGQSIYLWESGRSRPRDTHLAAIAALRTMGKRDAQARLEGAGSN